MKRFISATITLLLAILFIVYTEETNISIIKSIDTCINVIVPATYCYMVISTYLISGSLYKIIFKPIYIIFKKIIKLDQRAFSIFCISLIGGYPVGLKLISEIIAENKNYSEIASKIALFCYCISPSFAITIIGLGIYNSVEVGIIVYLSNICANIIAAIILSHFNNLKLPESSKEQKIDLIIAVNSSSSSLFRMCTIIILFNASIAGISTLLNSFDVQIPVLIKSMLEISNIIELNKDINNLPYISIISSFGGICVLFQCFSIINKTFSFRYFIISRIPIAFLSGLITAIIIKFVDIPVSAATTNHNLQFITSQNNTVIFMLILMFIVFIQKNEKNLKKG